MPKYLFLLRHAETAEKQSGQTDKERELTSKGLKEAMLIGIYLQKSNTAFDTIISSTATRTRSTTQIVSDAMRASADKIIYEDQLYEASLRTFLALINKLDDDLNTVMFVGHNPTISYLAEFLASAPIGDMATGGLVTIKFDMASWSKVAKSSGELVRYVAPSMLENN
jgi:phosphohistidine phosphatase